MLEERVELTYSPGLMAPTCEDTSCEYLREIHVEVPPRDRLKSLFPGQLEELKNKLLEVKQSILQSPCHMRFDDHLVQFWTENNVLNVRTLKLEVFDQLFNH